MAKRGFSTSSLTKSHHFRRLTSACDKCSTSSCLPISLELETPEASAACKIKNDHLIHSSTKYISGERRKVGGRGGAGEKERERESVSPAHCLTPLFTIHLNQLLLNEALIQKWTCALLNRLWHCRIFFSLFPLTLWEYLHCSAFPRYPSRTSHGSCAQTPLIAEGALCRLRLPLNHLNGAVNKNVAVIAVRFLPPPPVFWQMVVAGLNVGFGASRQSETNGVALF